MTLGVTVPSLLFYDSRFFILMKELSCLPLKPQLYTTLNKCWGTVSNIKNSNPRSTIDLIPSIPLRKIHREYLYQQPQHDRYKLKQGYATP